jgi:hypothetical protein
MSDNLYVMESWVRTRIDDLHAAAARDRLVAALPARPPLLRRMLSTARGLLRAGDELAPAPRPR